MADWIILLAEGVVETVAVPGAAGWVGASMLGSVLAWLFFAYLPAKDKQLMALIESRDALVKELAADYRKSFLDLTVRFQDVDRERRADYKTSLREFAEMAGVVVALQKRIDEGSKES